MTLRLRRSLLLAPAAALALSLAGLAISVTAASGPGPLDWVLCGLFVAVMTWESLVVWQAVLGFGLWLRGPAGRSRLERRADALEPVATGRSRTAVAVPIFDEDVAAVFAGVAVIRRSLARLGRIDDIDLHVLSDTREAATAAAEERAFARARRPAGPALFYRRRSGNAGRKAGNVAEFLERTRGRYDFAVVLDADSLMSGSAIRKLIRLMEENDRVGLIQTISYAAGRHTLFARIQQFAVKLYAPLSLKGQAFWQGPDALYYGHNAILRCEPFLQHARLPVLPGRPPLGGEILCHDVVEAALLTRAGWEVRVLTDLDGTWEEMPTNAVDLLGRERRWCQGNLQHMRVAAMPGLTAGSRGNILLGIGGYLMAPLWWAFLLVGALRILAAPESDRLGILAYGVTEPGGAAAALLALGAAYLLLPRLLSVARALGTARERAGFGGAGRLLAGTAAEQVFSLLLTPTLSVFTVRFVLQTLAGTVVPWNAQSRADRVVGWPEAVRVLGVNLALGCALAVPAWLAGGWYALWMAPTILGLLAGPPLIAWSSRRDLGEWARERGLFVTVDETAPAAELLDLHRSGAAAADPGRDTVAA